MTIPESCTTRAREGVKIITIANRAGQPLVTIKIDDCIDENLVIPFISAIKSFSHEVLKGGQDMSFTTGGIDLYAFTKQYDGGLELMIFALMDPSMKKQAIRAEAEAALDSFVMAFGTTAIASWNGDATLFKAFEANLQQQVHGYYEKLDKGELATRSDRRGILARLFKKRTP